MTKAKFIRKFQFWMTKTIEAYELGHISSADNFRGRCWGLLDMAFECDVVTYQEFETLYSAIDALGIITHAE